VPIVPGILPIANFGTAVRFAGMCGAVIPNWMHEMFDGLDNDPETRKLVAAMVAAEQARALAARGAEDFHFYTLNRADLTYAICHALGVRPKDSAAAP
jgi:methylenetetrahydrofolate reductase (NADPH)